MQHGGRLGLDHGGQLLIHQDLGLEAIAIDADVKFSGSLHIVVCLVAAGSGEFGVVRHGLVDALQQGLGTFVAGGNCLRGGLGGCFRGSGRGGRGGGVAIGLAAADQNSGAQRAAQDQRSEFFHNVFPFRCIIAPGRW